MESISSSQHPALLFKRCELCGFSFKWKLTLATQTEHPTWDLYCPNITCPKFGVPMFREVFKAPEKPLTTDTGEHSNAPDTTIVDCE